MFHNDVGFTTIYHRIYCHKYIYLNMLLRIEFEFVQSWHLISNRMQSVIGEHQSNVPHSSCLIFVKAYEWHIAVPALNIGSAMRNSAEK